MVDGLFVETGEPELLLAGWQTGALFWFLECVFGAKDIPQAPCLGPLRLPWRKLFGWSGLHAGMGAAHRYSLALGLGFLQQPSAGFTGR